MALAKFSKFKKERSVIKEARSKEKKIKNFNKVFNEKLSEIGVKSISELSEEQIQKVLSSLSTVNEDRMREIEKDGIIAGTPKPAGSEGEVAKKHTFDSPQAPDAEDEAAADDMKAEESVDESKINEGVVEDIRANLIDKPVAKIKELYKKHIGIDPRKEIASNAAAMITMIATMAAENKVLAKALLMESEEEVSEGMNEKEIKSEKEFDDYADDLLKKAHPDDFDEATAKKVKDGLKKKYKDNFGAMVGALTSGFGG